jgi:hypothetical protein
MWESPRARSSTSTSAIAAIEIESTRLEKRGSKRERANELKLVVTGAQTAVKAPNESYVRFQPIPPRGIST